MNVPVLFPLFVIVTVCTAEVVSWVTVPKGTGLGKADRTTVAAIPFPPMASEASVTKGLPFAEIINVPERGPTEVGENASEMVQEVPEARIFPSVQVFGTGGPVT